MSMIRALTFFGIQIAATASLTFSSAQAPVKPKLEYVKKPTRHETIVASFQASGLPDFSGKWYILGPFDNAGGTGFHTVYPPERQVDLSARYADKNGKPISWQEFRQFRLDQVVNLAVFDEREHVCCYLFTEITAREPTTLTLSLGSDDGVILWINGQKVHENNVHRAAAPDQDRVQVILQPGRNRLLAKICNDDGLWSFYLRPEFPGGLETAFRARLERDFAGKPANPLLAAEARHYRILTQPIPAEIVLEVGGLAIRPDGKMLCCTRRGDIWLITGHDSDDPSQIDFKRFASGLHEPLGLCIEGRNVYVVQRPELTRIVDRDGDDVADEFFTVCDAWGVSGDYHEFAFGPARDREGNFYVTLNVGFGGGHQAKAPWRGWCVKITPKGELIPYAAGLRSPNGINFSPQGDLFYCDNQGEWVATCKMHHVRPGDYYGHPAGLRYARFSPFADRLPPENHPSGMLYDGQPGSNGVRGMPPVTPPAIWFPYGRMGKSASEPVWDTTEGKFGPFAGQCFVGDQTQAMIMRVFLEKVDGTYQGACFPFRNGFECGINRMVFGPDGSLHVGMTNRGWGSLGGRPYGLQRVVYTGVLPFEIHSMSLTPTGFELTFTKPLGPDAEKARFDLQSHTYHYWSTYGSPEEDRRPERVTQTSISGDRTRVRLDVARLSVGRVYELHVEGLTSADGDALLHPEAYYTLNRLRR